MTPGASIATAIASSSEAAVARGCLEILTGGEVPDEFLLTLAGPAPLTVLRGWTLGLATKGVGASRLLHAWDDAAAPLVQECFVGESWRVRETACRVSARRALDEALEELARLRSDPVPRVRRSAERAVIALIESGA